MHIDLDESYFHQTSHVQRDWGKMIAHEVNQPLGALVNNADACLSWLSAENLEEARNSLALVTDDA